MAKARFAFSNAARSVAMSAALILILLLTLAGAYALSASRSIELTRTVRVGSLELTAPADWIEQPPRAHRDLFERQLVLVSPGAPQEAPPEASPNAALATSPRAPSDQLRIGLLRLPFARSPLELTRVLAPQLLPRGAILNEPIEPLRLGAFEGVRLMATQPQGESATHVIQLLTEDGRRYWVMHLTMVGVTIEQDLGRVARGVHLLEAMARSAKDRAMRSPSAADLQAAGLSVDPQAWPDSLVWQPRRGPEHAAGDAITFVPRAGMAGGFVIARARGTIALPEDAAQGLSPERQLAALHERLLGRPPRAGDLVGERVRLPRQGEPGGPGEPVRLWRLVLADETQETPLRMGRILYYVQPSRGSALLLEGVGAGRGLRFFEQHAPALVAALLSSADAPAADARATASTFEAALAHGQTLATRLRAGFVTPESEQVRYYLTTRLGQDAGFLVERQGPHPERPGRVLGQAMGVYLGPPEVRVHNVWAVQRDLSAFDEMVRGSAVGGDGAWRFRRQYANGTLRLLEGPLDEETLVWSEKTPPAFVPALALDNLPIQQLEDGLNQPGLVWCAFGRDKPWPYWLTMQAVQDDQGPGYRMLLRPVLALDAVQVEYDARGQLVRYLWHNLSDSLTGSAPVLREVVDRAALLQHYPNLQQLLDQWDKEASFDDEKDAVLP